MAELDCLSLDKLIVSASYQYMHIEVGILLFPWFGNGRSRSAPVVKARNVYLCIAN
jgi:hypothetical protein